MAGGSEADAEEPTVSVVMPFFDAAPFLREAAGSVLGQSWEALDLVLVDDGGTDGSERIARELAAGDPRVRVLTHEGRRNRGTGPSRALGITEARGDLIAFLDADDVWDPHHLRDQIALLGSHPEADIVCGRAWDWRSWADSSAEDVLSDLPFAPGAVVEGGRLLSAVLRNGHLATPTCSLLARRQVVAGVAQHVEAFPALYEDQVVNSWVQLRSTAVLSGATSAWYRMHPASISARLREVDPARARLRFLTWLQEQLPEPGEDDPELRQLLATALSETEAWLAASPVPSRVRRIVDAALPLGTRRRLAGVRSALGRGRLTPVEPWAEQVDRLLWQNGADLRGDVLLLSGGEQPVRAPAGVSVQVRPWPRPVVVPGPGHPLAALPSSAYDCAVLVPQEGPVAVGGLGLRHLRRALRPAGVLMVVLPGWDDGVAAALRTVFGGDAISGRAPDGSRSPGAPVVVRAVVPVG